MTIDIEKEYEEFEEWFEKECPTDAVAVRMHEEDALDYLNAMMPIRYKRYAWDAWLARAEKDAARIAELEAKLAAIEAQEPVAMMAVFDDWSSCVPISDTGVIDAWKAAEFDIRKLYTSPPLRELTDEDIERIHDDGNLSWFDFARAIEAWLKGGE